MLLTDIEKFIGGTWWCRDNNTTWQFQRNLINADWYWLRIEYEKIPKEQKYRISHDRLYGEYYIQTENDGNYKIIKITSTSLILINEVKSVIVLVKNYL